MKREDRAQGPAVAAPVDAITSPEKATNPLAIKPIADLGQLP